MIFERILFAAKRGFAWEVHDLKSAMVRIANSENRSQKYKNGNPSDETVCGFRARHRELAFRNTEDREQVKLKGESFEHVKTYEDTLREVHQEHPGCFDNGDRLCNMDETHIDGEFGKRRKVFSSAATHHGGYAVSSVAGGRGKHITVVVAVSASGRKAPPFFIVAGKLVMSNWFLPLEKDIYKFDDGELLQLTENKWFPSDAAVVMSENGSMDISVIHLFVKHLDRFVRKFVPAHEHYVLLLDGHSSRKGLSWLEECSNRKCEVLQSPANTSHFLQPCDQLVNKSFQTSVRATRDALITLAVTDVKAIKIKLMLGVVAYRAISESDITNSWKESGLWPMLFDFAKRWWSKQDDTRLRVEAEQRRIHEGAIAGRLGNVRKRATDAEMLKRLADIVQKAQQGPHVVATRAIQEVEIALRDHESINKILMSTRKVPQSANTKASNNTPKNTALPGGAPAEYFSHRERLEKQRQIIEAKRLEDIQKEEERKAKKREQQKRNRTSHVDERNEK